MPKRTNGEVAAEAGVSQRVAWGIIACAGSIVVSRLIYTVTTSYTNGRELARLQQSFDALTKDMTAIKRRVIAGAIKQDPKDTSVINDLVTLNP